MPSESAGAATPPLPPDLQADYSQFVEALSPWLAARGSDRDRTLELLTRFGLLVHDHAYRFGLISPGDRSSIFTRHILDSLSPLTLFHEAPASAFDVGSGGGFPGIPLAIAWPTTVVTLIERREKKAAFLERAVRELALKNVKVVPSRVEDLEDEWRSRSQASAFIRAVASLPSLLESLEPYCEEGARWVYFLGANSSSTEILATLGPRGGHAEVARGLFGGQLLHGRFGGGV
jgi:16S rRNA (guanine527-N7)-methyltransferase